MSAVQCKYTLRTTRRSGIPAILALAMLLMPTAYAKEKKDAKGKTASSVAKKDLSPKSLLDGLDLSRIVWPNPPAITRIKYLNYWAGEPILPEKTQAKEKKKASWMERVAGVATGDVPQSESNRKWLLVSPTAVAADSKGRAYIADSKVRAIFVVDTETGKFELIKTGDQTRFGWLSSLVIDDADYLYVGDSKAHRIIVFDPEHKLQGAITEGVVDPSGMSIDKENRLLYVADAVQDLVLVYDADPPYKLLRKIGKPGMKHTSTAEGEFAAPVGVAVDNDGNVYVTDTWNDRVQVFDGEGNFVRAFGKPGDGPGYFARPKGIAVDSDGHLWVADAVQDRIQVFTPEGRLLIWMGSHGIYPGQFQALASIAFDRNNRLFTTELMPGRMQMFRYFTNDEALAEKKKRDEEAKKKAEERRAANPATTQSKPDGAVSK